MHSSTALRVVSYIALALLFATTALANTWTNTLGGVFSDGGNWKEGVAPTSGVEAKFSDAAGTFTVTATGDIASGIATFDGDQNVTLDLGAGHTWTIDNNRNFNVGYTADANTSLSIVSGCVTGAYKILLGEKVAESIHLTVANPGTVLRSNRDDLCIGWNGGNADVRVLDGAVLQGGRGMYVGYNATASSNTVLVTGSGSLIGNGPTTSSNYGIIIGEAGSDNTVRIADGAVMTNTLQNLTLGNKAGADRNSLIFDGTGVFGAGNFNVGMNGGGNTAVFTNGAYGTFYRGASSGTTFVGNKSSNNRLDISSGSYFCPGSHLYLGSDAKACSNIVRIAGVGTVVTNRAYDFNCGNYGSYNTWIIEDGAYARPVRDMIVGVNGGASHNTLTVRGTGTNLKIGSGLYSGKSGTNNVVLVEDGARIDVNSAIYVGHNGISNLLSVVSGSVVTNNGMTVGTYNVATDNAMVVSNATLYSSGNVTIGSAGSRSRAEILGGANVRIRTHLFIGGAAGSSNSFVRVSGKGTQLYTLNYDINVGNVAPDCCMEILDGALVDSKRTVFVGQDNYNNKTTGSNGVLRVANATMSIGTGTLHMDYAGRLEIAGSNTVVNAKTAKFLNNSTLSFEIGREGFLTPVTVSDRLYWNVGTKLVVDAIEYAKAGGGDITLMNYKNKTGTIDVASDMTLLPAGIEVFEESDKLRIHVPNLAGTLILLK